MDYTKEQLSRVIGKHLPGRALAAVVDRGIWARHIVELTLDDGQVVFLKAHVHEEWADSSEKEAYLASLLAAHGFPAPPTIGVDTSREILGQTYILQGKVRGVRLGDLLRRVGEEQATLIYTALGRFYRRLHAVHYARSGWIDGPGRVLGLSPNDHMHHAFGDTVRDLVARGRLAPASGDRLLDLFARNLAYLKDHTPSLIHGTIFFWTVHLVDDGGWQVTHLSDMGDMLYWDPAYDLASIKYPPFGEESTARWQAFLAGYGEAPEEKRLALYGLMQRVTAATGGYLAPQTEENDRWEGSCLQDIDARIAALEG